MTERKQVEKLHREYLVLRENTPLMHRDGEECKAYHKWYNAAYVYFKSFGYLKDDPDLQVFVNAEKEGNCFILENIYDSISPSYNVLMAKTQNGQNADVDETPAKSVSTGKKKPLVFISHRGSQVDFVTALVNLLNNCGFTKDNLFCSSVPGFNIDLDEDIIETLRKKFINFDIYVVYVFSTDFFDSAYCLNEMGAAWVLQVDYSIIVTQDMDESKIDGVVSKTRTRVSFKDKDLQLMDRMIQLRNKLLNFAGLPLVDEIDWNRYYSAFLDRLKQIENKPTVNKTQESQPETNKFMTGNLEQEVNKAIYKLGEFSIKELQTELGFENYTYLAQKIKSLVQRGELITEGTGPRRRYRVKVK